MRFLQTLHGTWVSADLISTLEPWSRAFSQGESQKWTRDRDGEAPDIDQRMYGLTVTLTGSHNWNVEGGDPSRYVVFQHARENIARLIEHTILDWLANPNEGLLRKNIVGVFDIHQIAGS